MAVHIDWTDEAHADIRALDRATAMRIFDGLHRCALSGEGDLKMLTGKHAGKLRLRIGEFRVFFRPEGHILRILSVRHRKDAYR